MHVRRTIRLTTSSRGLQRSMMSDATQQLMYHLDHLYQIRSRSRSWTTIPKKSRSHESSQAKLSNHPLWPLLQQILQMRSLVEENFLTNTDFLPRNCKPHQLYDLQLQRLAMEYGAKRFSLEKWLGEQNTPETNELGLKNLFLIPMNIEFRNRINEVHRYAMDMQLVKPLKDCVKPLFS